LAFKGGQDGIPDGGAVQDDVESPRQLYLAGSRRHPRADGNSIKLGGRLDHDVERTIVQFGGDEGDRPTMEIEVAAPRKRRQDATAVGGAEKL
jgi:hypothetical protein